MAADAADPTSSGATLFTSDEERREFRERALQTLRGNDLGSFIKPGRKQYPHQWNWDAALVALGLSRVDEARARQEVEALLRAQWSDGMVPHIIYHEGPSDYFPTPDFWQTDEVEAAPTDPAASGLTQPPILATCVRLMHERSADRDDSLAFVRRIYPALYAWHAWWRRARDPEGSGLAAIVHPWESGTDNAARWVEPLIQVTPTDLPPYQRRDYAHVDPDERPRPADYERFIHLIDLFRRRRYHPPTLWAESPFLVRDTLVNALLYRADRDLLALARELGEPTDELEGWADALERAFAGLWDERAGLYYAFDVRNDRPIRENGCATFMALFAGLASEEQARVLVERHLNNPDEYAPSATSAYYLPSQAKNHYLYEPRRYWRGPVWIHINWMLIEGLRRYGYDELAERVRRDSLELMRRSGFVEYYDPRDGSPAGARDFSWSAALALELLGD